MPTSSSPPPGRHPVLRKAAAVLAAGTLALTLASAAGWTAINNVEGNLTVDNSLSKQLTPRTDNGGDTTAENILIVGTDTRTGQGKGYGDPSLTSSGNGSSDTTILLHISADRTSAFAVSIPRDSWVTRPGCKSDGTTDNSFATGKFNEAFYVGGRGCVIAAVKYLTGVPISHFVEVNFNGFKAIVAAMGGVTICTTKRLYDPIYRDANGHYHGSGLDIPKGTVLLNPNQAIAFVRARNLDPTADVGRIDRQKKFISSIIRSATDGGLLTNPAKLYSVLSAVTGALTVDSGLSGDALKTFLLSLQGISPSKIVFYTVPFKPRGDNSNLLWKTEGADPMWAAMKNDTPYSPTAAPTNGQPVLTVSPADISVTVLNGSGVKGLGRKAADQLIALGYKVTSVSNAPTSNNATSSITYDPGRSESVKTLAWSAGVATPTSVSGQGKTMVLTVGKNWSTARAAAITSTATTTHVTVAADASCIS